MDISTAYIALGSNLGNSRQLIHEAIAQLQQLSDEPVKRSSLWQTTPVDCPPDSPLFINAVVGLIARRGETPETLLSKLQNLEKEFGRQKKVVLNEPRPLDLDLIVFGNEIRSTITLTIPHPRAHLRQFVLRPLAEIAPHLILPGCRQDVKSLVAELKSDEQLAIIPD